MTSHSNNASSHAFPKRLFQSQGPDGEWFHELAGQRLERGTLLMLQLVDETWLRGVYTWDQPASDLSYDPSKPPLFQVFIADPHEAERSEPLTVSFYLPDDAVLRIDPRWKHLTEPRAPRAPRAARAPRRSKP